jgi:thioredoxin
VDDPELEAIRARKLADLQRIAARPVIDHPVELTGSSFGAFIAQHPIAVVDCWAAWCGPCRVMEPHIASLARELQGRVAFGKLNVDEHPRTAEAFEVSSIPTLLLFRQGKLADRIVGAVPPQAIRTRLGSSASPSCAPRRGAPPARRTSR